MNIKQQLFLALAILAIVAVLFVWLRPALTISADSFNIYNWFRSPVFDGNLDFANESNYFRERFNVHEFNIYSHKTATGLTPNPFPVGPAIIWFPFLILAYFTTQVLQIFPDTAFAGYGPAYETALSLSSVLYGTAGLLLLVNLLKKMFPRLKQWAMVVFAIFLASPLVYYMTYEARMAHADAFFVNTLFVFYWLTTLSTGQTGRQLNWKRWAVLGALLGLVALIRWQDVIIGILPLAELLKNTNLKPYFNIKNYLPAIKKGLIALVALFIVFIPQMIGWKVVYGSFLLKPPSNTHMDLLSPAFFKFMFNFEHGAFIWHPLFLIGILGLVWMLTNKKQRFLAGSFLAVILTAIYVNGTLSDWFGGGGGSFGARRLISVLPLVAVGVGFLYQKISSNNVKIYIFTGLLIALMAFNILLLPQAGKGWLWGPSNSAPIEGLHLISPAEILKNDWSVIQEQFGNF